MSQRRSRSSYNFVGFYPEDFDDKLTAEEVNYIRIPTGLHKKYANNADRIFRSLAPGRF
jgi:hypothetical protein